MVIASIGFTASTAVMGLAHFAILPAAFETAGQIILFPIRVIQLLAGMIF